MDISFWAARINSARQRLSNSDNVVTEGEEDVRAWFPCPFCYVEIEVQMLCNHLQEEHCFDFKNAVCPICAATLSKDPLGHFMLQHSQSVKRRRKYHKSGFWNNTAAISGRDPHEINYSCTNLVVGRHNGQEPTPDPLLLPFLCGSTYSDPNDGLQDKSSHDVERWCWCCFPLSQPKASQPFEKPMQVDSASFFLVDVWTCSLRHTRRHQCTSSKRRLNSKLAVYDPALEEEYEEKSQRAAFLQELVASTIF